MTGLDPATSPRSRPVRKRALPVSVNFAEAEGILDTREGPVPYDTGDAIVTGVEGERYPTSRRSFLERYEPVAGTEPGKSGSYVRRPETVAAVELGPADLPLEVTTSSGGVLRAKPGDWLVRYAPGDLGVVDGETFRRTYEVLA